MSTTSYPNDGMCHETSGFLFSHRCDRLALNPCVRCGKPVCADHGHVGPDGTVCTTCLKREPAAQPQAEPGPAAQTVQGSTSRPYTRAYYDDPYFYAPYWYTGYSYGHGRHSARSTSQPTRTSETPGATDSGTDPNDFTEGDSESLRNEGDEAFESEMGES